MQNKIKLVDAVESSQIIRELFMNYIKNIDVGIKWELEYLAENTPSICFKQISTAAKTKESIGGSYEAELPFYVYLKQNVEDTNSVIEMTQTLNDLAMVFEKETKENFPNLKFTNIIPKSLEMTSTPADADGIENNVAIFGATYRLLYKKRGRY